MGPASQAERIGEIQARIVHLLDNGGRCYLPRAPPMSESIVLDDSNRPTGRPKKNQRAEPHFRHQVRASDSHDWKNKGRLLDRGAALECVHGAQADGSASVGIERWEAILDGIRFEYDPTRVLKTQSLSRLSGVSTRLLLSLRHGPLPEGVREDLARKAGFVYARIPFWGEVMSPSDSRYYDGGGGRRAFDAARRLYDKAGAVSYQLFLVLATDLAVCGDKDGLLELAKATSMDRGRPMAQGFCNAHALEEELPALAKWILKPDAEQTMRSVIQQAV